MRLGRLGRGTLAVLVALAFLLLGLVGSLDLVAAGLGARMAGAFKMTVNYIVEFTLCDCDGCVICLEQRCSITFKSAISFCGYNYFVE